MSYLTSLIKDKEPETESVRIEKDGNGMNQDSVFVIFVLCVLLVSLTNLVFRYLDATYKDDDDENEGDENNASEL